MSWQSVRLRRLFLATGGSWGSEPEDGQITARCIRGTDFDYSLLRTNLDRAPLRGFTTSEYTRRVARRGDLIIEKSGGGEQQPVGRVVLHDQDEPAMPTNFAGRLRPTAGVDSRFATYLMASLYAEGRTKAAIRQTTGIQNLDLDALLTHTVSTPTLTTQETIADFLDSETGRIDTLIAKKQRMIEVLDERRDRDLDSIALPGISPSSRPSPAEVPLDMELGAGWHVSTIGRCLHRITYGFTNPMPTTENDGPFMLTANDIGEGFIRFDTARRTTQDAFSERLTGKSRPRPGDILLTKDGTLGRVAFFEGGLVCINQSVAVLTPNKDRVEPDLLFQLLRVPAYRDALIFNAGGTTIKHLYISRVVKQGLGLPTRAEHLHLAHSLATIHERYHRQVAALSRSTELLQEHRQALITAAVAGDIDIPGAAA